MGRPLVTSSSQQCLKYETLHEVAKSWTQSSNHNNKQTNKQLKNIPQNENYYMVPQSLLSLMNIPKMWDQMKTTP
jgi:hypothetical protein